MWWSDCPARLKGWFDRVWVCGYAYDYAIPGETFSFPRLSISRALVLCPVGNTGDTLEQSGVAESMRRIYANDRLQPDLGVASASSFCCLGMADPQTAAPARERNLTTARRLGRNFLTAAAGNCPYGAPKCSPHCAARARPSCRSASCSAAVRGRVRRAQRTFCSTSDRSNMPITAIATPS